LYRNCKLADTFHIEPTKIGGGYTVRPELQLAESVVRNEHEAIVDCQSFASRVAHIRWTKLPATASNPK